MLERIENVVVRMNNCPDPSLYDYYKELNRRYDQWYEEYKESPKSKSMETAIILWKILKQKKKS